MNNIQSPSAILFDADGTLYESEKLNFKVNQITARKLHDYEITWDLYDEHVRLGTSTSAEMLQSQGIKVDPEQYLAHKYEIYKQVAGVELSPMPNIVKFLKLCQSNKIKCIIISAARKHYIQYSLEILSMDQYFEAIISYEDIDNRGKPHPYPYHLGIKVAATKPENCLAIEDTGKGIQSAKLAGLKCIGIHNDSNTPQELKEADALIEDYDELIKMFGL